MSRGRNAVARSLAVALALLAWSAVAAPAAQGATLAIGDVTVLEGTDALGTATFTVTLSEPQVSDVQVNWQAGFGGGQRPASQPADFLAAQGVLVFAPGDTVETIGVSVVGDAIDEFDETFVVTLTQPVGATLGDPSGRATIDDDDDPPVVSVADATVSGGREGSGANRLMVFSVSLSRPSGKTVEVPYETKAGTAIAQIADPPQAGDFEHKTGVLTFLPNSVLLQVTVVIVGDEIDEGDEQFTLELGSPREPMGQVPTGEAPATVGDGVGIGSIIDDDGPLVSVADVRAPEGSLGASPQVTVSITLDKASPQPVSAGVATTNGSAVTPADYSELPQGTRAVIPAGSTRADVTVTLAGDDLDEEDERFRVQLTNVVGGRLADNLADVTIADDDATPSLVVASFAHPEGTGGTSVAAVTLTLSAPAGRPYTVPFQTLPAGATPDMDYAARAGEATFAAGETSAVVEVVVAGDDELEDDEGVIVEAIAPGGGVVTGLVTIVDDDLTAANTPRLSIAGATVVEGDSGTRTARFAITLDRPIPRAVSADVATIGGTAVIGQDVLAAPAELVIPAGALRGEVQVEVVGDRLFESNHAYSVRLANPRNARLGTGVGTGIITDDDAGLESTRVSPSRSIGVRRFLCSTRCPGLVVGYTTAGPGTLRVRVDGVAPPRAPKAKVPAGAAKPVARYISLVDAESSVRKGPGTRSVRRAGGRVAALIRRLRALEVRSVRITVTFTNRRGAADTRAFRLNLKT